jgi:hypothetical protein
MKRTLVPSLFLALTAAACSSEPTAAPSQDLDPEDHDVSADGKTEAWDSANNPAFVDSTFLANVNQLPLSGEGGRPTPSDYWPVYKDSLNVKWDGSMSPAEKYARAFGKDVKDVQEAVSFANGVKAHDESKACTTNADCESEKDGSVCAASYDGKEHRCIPTWWGICHGWAPYAIAEPQAKTAITRTAPDGTVITFYPSDLEALMSLMYTEIDAKSLSSRCNLGAGTALETDNAGRPTTVACRDMNAGSWHVLVSNMLGLRKTGFVLDQTLNFEVWNQPAWKYQITNAEGGRLPEVTPAKAMELLGQSGGTYTYNASARKLFHVEMDFTFVVESQPSREPHDAADFASTKHYEYILETDENGKAVGGEWVGGSKADHPDFAWWTTKGPTGSVAGIAYNDVKSLNDQAAGPVASTDRETLMSSVTLPDSFWSKSTYVALNLGAGYRKVTLTMTGTGEARMMVGPKGKNAHIGWGGYNICDANASGTANQTCTFNVDPAGGVYYVRARNEGSTTVVSIVADKQK